MKKKQIRNSLLLVLTALVWGIAFVAQSTGGDAIGPYSFNSIRSIIGSLVLIPVIFLLDRINPSGKRPKTKEEKAMQRALLQFSNPKNYNLVYDALMKAGREDLIGNGPKCLIKSKEQRYKEAHGLVRPKSKSKGKHKSSSSRNGRPNDKNSSRRGKDSSSRQGRDNRNSKNKKGRR